MCLRLLRVRLLARSVPPLARVLLPVLSLLLRMTWEALLPQRLLLAQAALLMTCHHTMRI